jgi:mRNA export factor
MSGLFGSAASTTSNTLGELKNDVELGSPPEDTISDLAFNPNPTDPKDFLAVASWDKKVRVYEILSNGQGQGKVAIDHDGPVFSVDFFKVCVYHGLWKASGRC